MSSRVYLPNRQGLLMLVLVLVLMLSFNLASFAAEADLTGVVRDTSGAVISGATVELRSASFKAIRQTGEDGIFIFESLAISSGTLHIRAAGFEEQEQPWQAGGTASRIVIVLHPASITQQITVVATRTPTRVVDSPGNVTVLSLQELTASGAVALDDILRQAPGFSLFRRSGSRTANPTSQGVSLRGLGASGASRAIVLSDDTPLNDPFGGWVYWDRIPRAAIETVEVGAGGASPLYGSDALGGAVNIVRRRMDRPALTLYTFYGDEHTPDASLFASEARGPWAGAIDSEVFHTDGYIPVPLGQRGTVDSFASSEYATGDLTLERKLSDHGRIFLRGSSFGESRDNGTLLTNNRTTIRELQLGGEWRSDAIGRFSIVGYSGREFFNQTFSSVSLDRNTEILTRVQRVPAQELGVDAQWSRGLGRRQILVAGAEAHEFRGDSDELAVATNTMFGAGGRQHNVGVFGEDIIQVTSRWSLIPMARVDLWTNFDAFSSTQPLATGIITRTPLASTSETFVSPRLGTLYRLTKNVALTGSGYRSFRAPTLNELYRSFRLGNILTLANNQLLAERLAGGEGGVIVSSFNQHLMLRGNFFWAEITRPTANVTLSTTPTLIIRERENLGRTRSRGLELDAEVHVNSALSFAGGLQYADATVQSFPTNPALVGLDIPQVPRHVVTVQARYAKPRWVLVGVQGRYVGVQYEDDINTLVLGRFFVMDLMVSHPLTHALDVFIAADNLLNQRYDMARTPVLSVAPPILARVGLRLSLGEK